MPEPVEAGKRTRPEILAALITAFAGLLAAVIASPYCSVIWAPSNPANSKPEASERPIEGKREATVDRRILYARMLDFRDRRLKQTPIKNAQVGLRDTEIRNTPRDIYDEALYLDVLYLNAHTQDVLKASLQSSGITDLTALFPLGLSIDREGYERQGGRALKYDVMLKDTGPNGDVVFHQYIVLGRHYYNGFQSNPDGRGYQSDGGIIIHTETKSAMLIFDFSALDYEKVFSVKPRLVLRREDRTQEEIPSQYRNGVLVGQSHKPPLNSYILCDWEWATEAIP
jgi:hypothetical protein